MPYDRRLGIGRSVGIAVAILLSYVSPVSAEPSCPENMIVVSRTDVAFVSSAATGSVIWVEGSGDQFVSWEATQPCPEGCYDLPRGTLVARGSNTLYGPGATSVSVADEYLVVGPAGPSLSFEVVLSLEATIEIEGTAFAQSGWWAHRRRRSGGRPRAIPRPRCPSWSRRGCPSS